MSKIIPNEVFSDLLVATDQRMKLLYKMPKKNKFLFIIEGIYVLDYWKDLYEKMHAIQITLRRETVLEDADFHLFLFFIKQLGDFFAGICEGNKEDTLYVAACRYFVTTFYSDQPLLTEDHEIIFFNAFPEKKPK